MRSSARLCGGMGVGGGVSAVAAFCMSALLFGFASCGERMPALDDCGKGEYCLFAGKGGGYVIQVCVPSPRPQDGSYLRFTLAKPDGSAVRLRKDIDPDGGDVSGQDFFLSGNRSNMLVRISDGATSYAVYINEDWHISPDFQTVEAGLVIEKDNLVVERADLTANHISNMSPEVFQELRLRLDGPERLFPVAGVSEESAMETAMLTTLMKMLANRIREIGDSGGKCYLSIDSPGVVNETACRLFTLHKELDRASVVLDCYAVDIDGRVYIRESDGEYVLLGGSSL